jgi:hypothetical protein
MVIRLSYHNLKHINSLFFDFLTQICTTFKQLNMKKLFKSLVVLSIASAAFLASCSKDDALNTTNPPSLKLTLELKGNDDNKLKKVTLTSNKTSTPLLSKELSGTTANEVVNVSLDQIGTWVFTVSLEGEGNTATASYEITVTAPASYGALDPSANPIPLGAQSATIGQFLDLSTGEVFEFGDGSAKANAAKIDLGYAYGNTGLATLFSPSNTTYHTQIYNDATNGIGTWLVKNATKIVSLRGIVSKADFEAATNDSIIVVNTGRLSTTPNNVVSQLQKDDVLLFEIAKNPVKKGLIIVDDITTSGTGQITIRRKIQI